MSAQQVGVLPLSFPAPGVAIDAHLAIGLDGKLATAGKPIFGFSDYATDGTEGFLCITGLTAMAKAGAVIGENDRLLMVDATGRVVPWTTGNSIAAIRVPTASVPQTAIAVGEIIEVYVCPGRPAST